jgi:tetratricopeptide (TPR) repeat protein
MKNMKVLIGTIIVLLVSIAAAVIIGRETQNPTPKSNGFEKPKVVVDPQILGNGGLPIAVGFSGPVSETRSLTELREAIEPRGRLALDSRRLELAQLRQPAAQIETAIRLNYEIGMLLTYDGSFAEAAESFEKAQKLCESVPSAAPLRRDLTALLGIAALRRGEIENCIECLGPTSCIFPIAAEAVHEHQAGSRDAIKYFTAYLAEVPGDVRMRWLLNLAYMTVGEYPDHVPPEYLIPLDSFQSNIDVGRFENVAPLVGLTSRGPNLAGGSVFDDFTGDNLPDIFATSIDADRGATLHVNRGDGTFEDRSDAAGLSDQIYALNVTRADFDNDGNLDVLLLRGAWEKAMRMSLLRNTGNGMFEDVTIASGLGEPIASEAAAWADYDNDGLIDLFVGGEYLSANADRATATPDPRNRSRLYHNLGGGKFEDVAADLGLVDNQCTKGAAWGDYDGDGRLDLFVSNREGPSRLFHNEGDRFSDVASSVGVKGAPAGFACWFWDYDNDGALDLYVNDFSISLADSSAYFIGEPPSHVSYPHLYRNLGTDRFREVSQSVGLDRPIASMGCNIADIDNDGFLDFYLGTGEMSLEALVPNLLFKNVGGKRFEDVTLSSGTGHLQKGHGVSFADWDCDGDLDFFVEVGGAVPGDKSYNLLFQNPGHGRHWLKVKLVGTKTNRAAIGARIHAVIKGPDGAERSIYRTVGNNSSFGGNSLVELIGLADATSVAVLEVMWPASGMTQTFRELAPDQMIEIIEGVDSVKPIPQTPLHVPTAKPRSVAQKLGTAK